MSAFRLTKKVEMKLSEQEGWVDKIYKIVKAIFTIQHVKEE